jgi:hypothetical protein
MHTDNTQVSYIHKNFSSTHTLFLHLPPPLSLSLCSSIRASCSAHLIVCDVVTLTVLDEVYKVKSIEYTKLT